MYSPNNPFATGADFSYITDWSQPNSAYNSYMTGMGPVSTSAGNLSYDDYLRQFYGNDPASLTPQTPGGNDWALPGFGGFLNVPADKPGGSEIPGLGSGSYGGGAGGAGSGGGGLTFDPRTDRTQRTGFASQNTGWDPWAGNPYAGAMLGNMWNGFLQNGQVAQQTSDAIWDTMKFNIKNQQGNEYNRAMYDLQSTELENQRAYYEAQAAELARKNDLESQRMANEMQRFADELKIKQQQVADAKAQFDAKLAAETQLGNRQLDVTQQGNQFDFDAMMKDIDAKIQAAQIQAGAQNYGEIPGSDQLDLQKQQLAMQQAQWDAKMGLFDKIAGMIGGLGGGLGSGGTGSGIGGGSGSGGGSGILPTNAGGSYGTSGIPAITARGLDPSTIRSGVSAIEGSPYSGSYSPSGSMTNAQRNSLSQDYGSLLYAGGQEAAVDAARELIPANARLALEAQNARSQNANDWASFGAQKERSLTSEQLAQQGNLYQMLLSLIG